MGQNYSFTMLTFRKTDEASKMLSEPVLLTSELS